LLYGRKIKGDRKDGRDKDKTQTRLTPVNGIDRLYWKLGIEATKECGDDVKITDGKDKIVDERMRVQKVEIG